METVLVIVLGLAVLGTGAWELRERRAERLERLNRESWELYRASRRIHDETAKALQSLFDEVRSAAAGRRPPSGLDR